MTVFPFLDENALDALELINHPLHIYSFEAQKLCWANAAGREIWKAGPGNELFERDLAMSRGILARLDEYRSAFAQGETRRESWTIYPRGEAVTMLSFARGVSLSGHAEAMLVESVPPGSSALPDIDQRGIEALRHTHLKVSLFSDAGEVLMRNSAALESFSAFDASLATGADHFRSMFARPADADWFRAEAMDRGVARGTATLALPGFPEFGVEASSVIDPVTGKDALLVSQLDVTALVQTTRQLRASEDAFAAVFELTTAPALVTAVADDSILMANKAAEDMFGDDAPAFATLFADATDHDAFRLAALASDNAVAEAQLKTCDGGRIKASVSAVRIRHRRHDALLIQLANIRPLPRGDSELEAALRVERRVSEMQRRYLQIAAHEFRTPLALIDGAAQRLERHAETLRPDEVRSRATRIRNTIKRLLALLDNTVERARSNRGDMDYAPTLTDPVPLIKQVAGAFLDSTPGLKIEYRLPDLPRLDLDHILIERALANMMANAIKYTDGEPRVRITAMASASEVRLLFEDWGIGIPQDDFENVFLDDFRSDNGRDRPGSGLGLSIVRHIMGLHGGSIMAIEPTDARTCLQLVFPRP